ncbi:MAG: hypothetical protein WCW02_00300 [Candidatus Buchananbacteria bacterium]
MSINSELIKRFALFAIAPVLLVLFPIIVTFYIFNFPVMLLEETSGLLRVNTKQLEFVKNDFLSKGNILNVLSKSNIVSESMPYNLYVYVSKSGIASVHDGSVVECGYDGVTTTPVYSKEKILSRNIRIKDIDKVAEKIWCSSTYTCRSMFCDWGGVQNLPSASSSNYFSLSTSTYQIYLNASSTGRLAELFGSVTSSSDHFFWSTSTYQIDLNASSTSWWSGRDNYKTISDNNKQKIKVILRPSSLFAWVLVYLLSVLINLAILKLIKEVTYIIKIGIVKYIIKE